MRFYKSASPFREINQERFETSHRERGKKHSKMASQRSTALLQILLMLLGLILFCSGLDCETWEAQRFRDCHCGNEYKDSEVHCQDDNTYYNVVSDQRKKKCNFTCLNGGILRELGPNYYRCDCGHTNYVGTCCERGK